MRKRLAVFAVMLLLVPTVFYIAGSFSAFFKDSGALTPAFDEPRAAEVAKALLPAKGGVDKTSPKPLITADRARSIVRFRDDADMAEIKSALAESGLDYIPLAAETDRIFVVTAAENNAFFAENADIIEYTEPDAVRDTLAVTDDPVALPAHESLGVFEVWDSVTASPDIIIAVLDTGVVREHEDLAGANILAGYNAVAHTAGVYEDSSGHGTAVTGVIAAAANNKKGIAGTAYGATILPVKISYTRTTIYSSDLISGIRFAADAGAKIINLSVGGYSSSFAEQEAVDYALSKGCIIIAASGNEGNRTYAGQKCYPASYDGVISVASSSYDGGRSSFSQYNESVAVAAPGEDVTVPVWDNGASNYKVDSGTSYSAAFVSGIAALLLSNLDEGVRFNSEEFLSLIISSCGSARNDDLGYGIINAPDMLAKSRLPIITGVTDGLVYSEKVTVGFNRGLALLDGEPISDGETVVTNGRHTLTVTDGENTVTARFRLDYSPLSVKYREYFAHAVFEFERGMALLDGFPYSSGTPITASGRHEFLLSDGDETLTRTIELGYAMPEVFGVADGATYNAPVGIRITGGGSTTLDGENVGNEIAVTDNGTHILSVSSLNGNRRVEYRFTVDMGDSYKTYPGEMNDPLSAVDEENGYILLYGDALVGARVCNLQSPNVTERVLELGRIYGHAVDGGRMLLFGDNGISVLERTLVLGEENCLSSVISPEGINYFVYGDNRVFCFGDGAVYELSLEDWTLEPIAEIDYGCFHAVYDSGVICVLEHDGDDRVILFDTETFESSTFYVGHPITRGNMQFGMGYLTVGNRLFDINTAELLMEFGGRRASTIRDGKIFSDTRVYDIASGEVLGIYPDELYNLYFGEALICLFYSNGRIDVVESGIEAFESQGSAGYAGTDITAFERVNDYRANLFYGIDRTISSMASAEDKIYFLFPDSNILHSVSIHSREYGESAKLRYFPSAVTTANGYITVCFADAPYVYIAPYSEPENGLYARFPELCDSAYYDGTRLLASCGGRLAYCDINGDSVQVTDIPADRVAGVDGRIVVLSGRTLTLYNNALVRIVSVATNGGRLTVGDRIAVGGQVYSTRDLELVATYRRPVLALGNGMAFTADGLYGIYDSGFRGYAPISRASGAVITPDGSLVCFGGGVISICAYGDGTALNADHAVSGVEDGGVYIERATVKYAHGIGYADGKRIESGDRITGTGLHNFTLSLPCGRSVSLNFTIVSRLERIEFMDSTRSMNIGETITLRLRYLPDGADSVPAIFTSDREGVTIDEFGSLTAETVGDYTITARVGREYGSFTAQCRVIVRDDLIVFAPESGLTVDRNNGFLLGVAPGTDVETLLSLLPDGRNGAVFKPDGSKAVYPLATGDRLVMYQESGEISDELTLVVTGDTDGDGYITAYDLYTLERILRGRSYPDYFFAAADISRNGINTNSDFYQLRNIVTGRLEGETGTPPLNLYGSAGIQTFTTIEQGGIIDVAVYLSGCKYARAVSGKIYYGEGLEYISSSGLGWDCSAYDNGEYVGFYAYSGGGEISGGAFRALIRLRFRVTAKFGEHIAFSSDGLTVNFSDGTRTVPFENSAFAVGVKSIGDFNIEILNSSKFEFSAGKYDYFASIPYDSALADIRVTRPHDCTVTIDGAVIPDSGSGTVTVTLIHPDGRSELYTIRIRRDSTPKFDSNCRLSRLEVEGFKLSPVFEPDILDYTVTVPHDTERLELYYSAQNKSATVFVGNTELTGDTTVINITVVTPEGESLVYRITANRLQPPDESSPEISDNLVSEPQSGTPNLRPAVYVIIATAVIAIATAVVIIRRRKSKGKAR